MTVTPGCEHLQRKLFTVCSVREPILLTLLWFMEMHLENWLFIVKVLTGFYWVIWNGAMLCFPIKRCLGHLTGDIHAVVMCYASKGCRLLPLIWINFMFLQNSGNFTSITFHETALISCNHFKCTVISQVRDVAKVFNRRESSNNRRVFGLKTLSRKARYTLGIWVYAPPGKFWECTLSEMHFPWIGGQEW